ncbi:MAG: tetratricopeptide repeat protein, partial [Bacteriovoracaceae bacterium]|nr:tetratricopeptide repeat protein [Bacteriovoracaceae bacterium]
MSDCWPSLEPEGGPAQALFSEAEELLDPQFGPDLGHSLYNLGKIHFDKSDITKAEKYFLRALDLLQNPGEDKKLDYSYILKTIGFLLRITSERMETQRALAYVAQTEKILQQLAQDPQQMNAEYYYNSGIVKTYREDYPAAQEDFLAAYQHAKAENSSEILAKSLLAIANNYYFNQEFDKSLESLKQLDVLLKKVNKSYLLGATYLCAGRVYRELGLYDQAMISLRKANKILQEKKSWNLYGYLLLARGTIYKLMGEFEHALMFFYLAIDSTDPDNYKRLSKLIRVEIEEVNDSSVDLYLDRTNRRLR